jgi:alpha-glucosidase
VIYHIYPRSFADANGDGIGDLEGIRGRLDYLSWLGINAIWISPCFPSPLVDFGYDVSDYCDIGPEFGALADFDRLVEDARSRGIRILLDLVPNHTSDRHPWFLDARRSRDSAKRDWYLWRDPAPDGGPPNNWVSVFGGSPWEWDAKTGQYYLHSFFKQQPDLNWRNPEVRRAIHDVMRFWLDRGVAGFRIDVIQRILKDPDLSELRRAAARERREPPRCARGGARAASAGGCLRRSPAGGRGLHSGPGRGGEVLRPKRRAPPRVQLLAPNLALVRGGFSTRARTL